MVGGISTCYIFTGGCMCGGGGGVSLPGIYL